MTTQNNQAFIQHINSFLEELGWAGSFECQEICEGVIKCTVLDMYGSKEEPFPLKALRHQLETSASKVHAILCFEAEVSRLSQHLKETLQASQTGHVPEVVFSEEHPQIYAKFGGEDASEWSVFDGKSFLPCFGYEQAAKTMTLLEHEANELKAYN